jgi:hypothetical protein
MLLFCFFSRQVARSKNNLAQVMFAKRLFKEAEPLCQDVLNILIAQRGPEHSEVLNFHFSILYHSLHLFFSIRI